MGYAALIASIAIHAVLFYFLRVGDGGDGGEAGKQQQKVKITILDKPSNVDNKSKDKPLPETKSKVAVKKKKKKVKPEQKVVDHKCDDSFYVGIGVQHEQNGSCRITHVGKGYPADRAGMQVGDLAMRGPDGDCPGRGPLGTMITVKVMRGTQVLTFTMVREKICTKDM